MSAKASLLRKISEHFFQTKCFFHFSSLAHFEIQFFLRLVSCDSCSCRWGKFGTMIGASLARCKLQLHWVLCSWLGRSSPPTSDSTFLFRDELLKVNGHQDTGEADRSRHTSTLWGIELCLCLSRDVGAWLPILSRSKVVSKACQLIQKQLWTGYSTWNDSFSSFSVIEVTLCPNRVLSMPPCLVIDFTSLCCFNQSTSYLSVKSPLVSCQAVEDGNNSPLRRRAFLSSKDDQWVKRTRTN